MIKRLWTEDEPFDFDGKHIQLTGAFGNPKPVQRPHPPIVIGGTASPTLRIVAEHADVWNLPGGTVEDIVQRGALLDRYCGEIGRDPASIARSIGVPVSYTDPGAARDVVGRAIDAGIRHIILSLPKPYPADVVRWITDEIIRKSV